MVEKAINIYIWRYMYSGSPRADRGRGSRPVCSVAPKALAWPLSLGIEPTQVFYVPWIRQLLSVLSKADTSRPGDCYDRVGAFPARGELVLTSSCLDAPEYQVAHSQGSALDLALMVASQALLVACGSESGPASQLFN